MVRHRTSYRKNRSQVQKRRPNSQRQRRGSAKQQAARRLFKERVTRVNQLMDTGLTKQEAWNRVMNMRRFGQMPMQQVPGF